MRAYTKQELFEQFDRYHREVTQAPRFGKVIVDETVRTLRFLIPEGSSILDVGCGDGSILAALKPGRGVGVDCSQAAIKRATATHPELEFHVLDAEQEFPLEGAFDFVLLHNVIGDAYDVWKILRNVRQFCSAQTRLILTYYNQLWEPAVRLATWLGLRKRQWVKSWFSRQDMATLSELNGFEVILTDSRCIFPLSLPPVSTFFNRLFSKLPFFHHFNTVTYSVARLPKIEREKGPDEMSVSIIIPTRNEVGNVLGAVERTPELGSHTELIFVDGDSNDGTVEEIEKQIERLKGKRDIRLIHQVPRNTTVEKKKMLKLGKGDAVRKGFAQAKGDVLMILDSDLTVPPEDMDKFYLAIAEGRADFINGNRLSYPLEQDSMRFLNQIANRIFGILFTWLLGQPVKDTLCGTKVLSRQAYQRIAANRVYFGDFDPFGDFDLLFGAAKLNMRIIDLPVRYRARTYGDIKIERFKHGLLLLKMCVFAFRRLKLQS